MYQKNKNNNNGDETFTLSFALIPSARFTEINTAWTIITLLLISILHFNSQPHIMHLL